MTKQEIEYSLAKRIVYDRPMTISTNYGDVNFYADEVKPIIDAAREVLSNRLKAESEDL